MMNPLIDKVKAFIKTLNPNDGSVDIAAQWIATIEKIPDITQLLQNSAFKEILAIMEKDFMARVHTLVSADPELRAMKKMFVRTLGMKGAEDRIEKTLNMYLDDGKDVE